MEFKSQICTTVEQSKRLMELGLKKETADMRLRWLYCHRDEDYYQPIPNDFASSYDDTLAWSLHRLIELMPEVIFDALLCVFKDSIRYEALVFDRIEVLNDVVSDNIYDNAIATIEWLIKEDYFNKEYLEEQV